MRFIYINIIAFGILVFVVRPSPVQSNDQADKTKRRAELQKDIKELHEKIAALSVELSKLVTITEVPRPNSGTYSTEEATKLLPKTMSQSQAVDAKIPIVAEWKNPTHGFRVHVHANNDIAVVDTFGEKKSGMTGLKSALKLSEIRLMGNPMSVLLTSEANGWQSDTEQQILKLLFQPSIQLYIVTDK